MSTVKLARVLRGSSRAFDVFEPQLLDSFQGFDFDKTFLRELFLFGEAFSKNLDSE